MIILFLLFYKVEIKHHILLDIQHMIIHQNLKVLKRLKVIYQ